MVGQYKSSSSRQGIDIGWVSTAREMRDGL